MSNNIKTLALGTGYAETASWAQWVVSHRVGFRTARAALVSLQSAVKDYIKLTSPNIQLTVNEVIRDIIHGTLQDHGELWEILDGHDWLSTPAWGTLNHRGRILLVNCADEAVAEPNGYVVIGNVIRQK